MKNFTCDKCGYPMEPATPLQIQHKKYDICTACHNEIMKGLDGKGEHTKTIFENFGKGSNMKDFYEKYSKFPPEDYLQKPLY